MNIWIVDDDIYFASRFKDRILSTPVFGSDKPKVELFHDGASFLESLERIKKDATKKPALIFLDVELPDSKGPLIFLDLLEEGNPLTSQIHFVSSMSFGRFKAFFESQELPVPPFTQKGSLEVKLEEILLSIKPLTTEAPRTLPSGIPFPMARRATDELDKSITHLRDRYYESGLREINNRELVDRITGLEAITAKLNLVELGGQATRLKDLLAQKRAPSAAKLKKEMRDLFRLGEKILESLRRL